VLHEIPLGRETIHGHFSAALPPVVTVDPGDAVRFQSLDAWWRWTGPDEDYFPSIDAELDDGHPLTGPIEVRGARAGDTLVVRMDEVVVGSWGETLAEPLRDRWRLDAAAGVGVDDRGAQVALAPFLGVVGMPPPEPGVHSTIPPRRFGGNIDCKELVAGTTLYLPVPVDGALLSAGDGHGAQGDGEVSGTAIECPLERVVLTLDVRRDLPIALPVARTADAWITLAFDADLDRAADDALHAMLDLMQREHGLDRAHAFALASVAVDLRVTQIVNEVKGVHAVLRDGAIRLG
jgi:acetamidase/formamidase